MCGTAVHPNINSFGFAATKTMDMHKITFFLVTGLPGIGKTTLVRKVCDKLSEQTKPKGFYTEEVRVNGQRIGFDVVSFGGTRGILAREQTTDNVRRPKVGKYSVYVQDFEQLALPLLKSAPLLVIDEIGKMELLSQRFEAAVNELLQKEQFMLAAIPSQTRQPIALVERLKKAPHAIIYEVTKANRNALVNAIAEQILETNHAKQVMSIENL